MNRAGAAMNEEMHAQSQFLGGGDADNGVLQAAAGQRLEGEVEMLEQQDPGAGDGTQNMPAQANFVRELGAGDRIGLENSSVLPTGVSYNYLGEARVEQIMGGHELDMQMDWNKNLKKPNEFLRFFLRMSFGAVMHPYEYARVLMQLGYEPLPVVVSKNWLGRPTLFLPNVHQYMRYIKHTDGIAGLYRGLASRILSNSISGLVSHSLIRYLGANSQQKMQPFRDYVWHLLRDGIVIIVGLGISHPFYVITVRQMAQFVGRETVYATVRGSIGEIMAQDGLLGFYAGFVPRLLFDLGVLFLTSTLGTICNRLFALKPEQREYNSALLQFASILLLYPLQVVGACMACSGSGVAAGAPPYMPIYSQWSDCLMDLSARRDHYRGAFVFRRTLQKMQIQRIYDPFTVNRMI